MKRAALFAGLLALPFAAFALDFSNATNTYTDGPFSKAETAGISVLTNLNAVQGNPDGTFAPRRSVNRAEFLKILFLSHPDIAVSSDDSASCFPDVQKADWFSRYVCLAKTRNVVGGYPDGFFRPANTVNYVEALKMLSELYSTYPVLCLDDNPHGGCTQYKTYENGAPWYEQYVDWAAHEGLLLPGSPAFNTPLTRGQVARLAAAYRAWNDGELAEYRAFERGETASSSNSSSSVSSLSSSSSSSSSSVSSVSSASSVSSSSTSSIFPSTSRFLLLGTRTQPAIDGTFTTPDEDGLIRYVDVTLRQEIKSIQSMILVDAADKDIGTLVLSTDNNSDHRKWRLTLPESSSAKLIHNVPTQLGVEYVLRSQAEGGVRNEFVDGIETFSMTVVGTTTGASRQIVPTNTHYPQSQTADARITGVINNGSGSYAMKAGTNKLLGRFAISGQTSTGGVLKLRSIDLLLTTSDVVVSNIRIGGASSVQQADCGMDATLVGHVTCGNIPEDFKQVGSSPLIISVYGDVAMREGAQTGGSLQLLFSGRGKIGQNGAIKWQDTTGSYNWIEETAPLQNGTVWTVNP